MKKLIFLLLLSTPALGESSVRMDVGITVIAPADVAILDEPTEELIVQIIDGMVNL